MAKICIVPERMNGSETSPPRAVFQPSVIAQSDREPRSTKHALDFDQATAEERRRQEAGRADGQPPGGGLPVVVLPPYPYDLELSQGAPALFFVVFVDP